jgi:hypothetical protein
MIMLAYAEAQYMTEARQVLENVLCARVIKITG